jgi:hypothetical protein
LKGAAMRNKTVPYRAKKPPLVFRLCMMFLFLSSVLTGLLKRWELFGLSLGVLLITLILVCYILLSMKIDERFDQLEKLIESKDDNVTDEQKE